MTTNLGASLVPYYEKKMFEYAYGEGWEYEWDYYHSPQYAKLVKSASAMLPPGRQLRDRRTKAHRWFEEHAPAIRQAYERRHPKPPRAKPSKGAGKTVIFTRYSQL